MLAGMKIYSDFPLRRALQILADFLAISFIGLGIWLGFSVGVAIGALAEIGRQISTAGQGFKGAMSDAAQVLGDLPIVGSAARVPFDAASGTGGMLETAGNSTEGFITWVGVILGTVVSGSIVWVVLMLWVRKRISFIKEATEASRLAKLDDGADLLALRGLVHGSSKDLSKVSANPVEDWRNGRTEVIKKLSAIELKFAGVRPRQVLSRIAP